MVICDMQLVRSYMDTAVANNLNVMRIWAQTVGFNRAPFQTSPGVYNENLFRGLDYTLDQARQRNLKASTLRLVSTAKSLYHTGFAYTPDSSCSGICWLFMIAV